MKCPACESDVPAGWTACMQCGAPLPPVGGRPGPQSHLASESPMKPPAGPPNPQRTEPIAMPAWNAFEERPSDAPPERHAAPGAGAPPAEQHTARLDFGAMNPMPPGYPPVSQDFGGPGAMPPPGYDPEGATPAGGPTTKDRKGLLLAGGIAAAAVLCGGLVYVFTQGSNQTQAPAEKPVAGKAAQQATAVNQILRSGRTARGHLPSPLRTCADVSAGVPGFQQVVQERQQELTQAKGLTVDQLQNGPRLRRSMIAAYRNSLDADQAYLAWAQEIQARHCGHRIAPLTEHYKSAISANNKAGPAKRQVAALWKPIASRHGLPVYAWNRL